MSIPDELPQEADRWGERLPRTVSLWSAVTVLVGITIGSGIFRVPATVAGLVQSPGPALACWFVGGVVVLLGALSMAELAAALPRSGGIFAYLLECYGPAPAFVFGWTELAVLRASALGATAMIFAEYLGYFVPLTRAQVHGVAAAAILMIGTINYTGVRGALAVLAPATLAKYVAVLALGLLAFTISSPGVPHHQDFWSDGGRLSVMATALVPIMYTYDGWADVCFMGGEIANPQRTLPLALVLGTCCVMLVYLLVNFGFWHALPESLLARSPLVATTVATRIPMFRGAGATVVATVVLLSTLSALHATLMTGSRVLFALGDRGLLFRTMATISPRFRSPSVAIWITTGLGVTYVLQSDFAQLADRVILGLWPFYMLTVAGVYVLRRTRPDLPRPYRTWGYPVVPALFVAISLGMLYSSLYEDPHDTVISLLVIAAGVPIYYIRRALIARAAT
ncbi:MAG TPA: amino acid permease [Steroidobacteraceae bacterium]|nr:amino acid permease [Steroidobacteraceae bacterium]